MILITSGAFLQGEFASEVGLLPPSFLPVGNKRLYEQQIAFLKKIHPNTSNFYISLPSSYSPGPFDSKRIEELGLKILYVPEGLSLGESILYCWNATGEHHDALTVLHGDTLFSNFNTNDVNVLSVHENRGFYKRAILGKQEKILEQAYDDWSRDSELVLSGYFSISNPLLFMKSLVEAKSDFTEAVIMYHKQQPFTLVSDGDWLDFGHINSFYHSRTSKTTERVFNELNINKRIVSKASKNKPMKIYAEGSWFEKLPLPLRLFTPALVSLEKGDNEYNGANYKIEYLYLLPISDLYVFSHITNGSWRSVFSAISEMLNEFKAYKPSRTESEELLEKIGNLYLPKTLDRLKEFFLQTGFDIYDKKYMISGGDRYSLIDIAHASAEYIKEIDIEDIAISHGDLCFSNLLYDNRVESVKCIDPRGLTPTGDLTIYGDRRYDLAKLYHSVIGLYDFIIAGHYFVTECSENNTNISFSLNKKQQNDIINIFREEVMNNSGYNEKEILAITVHLFLSMLPLHSDQPERQFAFIANTLRLFEQLKD